MGGGSWLVELLTWCVTIFVLMACFEFKVVQERDQTGTKVNVVWSLVAQG